ncbi:hypothetical protein SAMN05444162_4571 [Paenibacillaceae bacterium GAS479]|nr:hypothetical protein SAMN05444162_4571 [Paenibacillaceae bacterium GAS479]
MNNRSQRRNSASHIVAVIFGIIILLIVVSQCSNASSNNVSMFDTSYNSSSYSTGGQGTTADATVVPWDYRVTEGEVGDLVGGDMTILPDNQLMANDDQYGTGDKIWTLQYMTANLKENDQGKASVTLSTWNPIKSYKTKEAATADLDRLKVKLKTKVKLVGVYKTKLDDKTRQFAVLRLPTGQQVKQPIDEKRYSALKSAKEADIIMEEIHDHSQFDLAYSKFRGWAS